MRALIELPSWPKICAAGGPDKAIFRPVCGIPLLVRVINGATRKQRDSLVLVVHPPELDGQALKSRIEHYMEGLILVRTCITGDEKDCSAILEKSGGPLVRLSWNLVAGIHVCCDATAKIAEYELVRGSGKATDGMYSRLNRQLCWPVLRLLTHTKVTPNVVSFAGLMICLLSAVCFSAGNYLGYVAGAAFFFVAGLCDEMDGMLARIKFQESPLGCWLESFADHAGYILVFGGMTLGLYRQRGDFWLWMGGLFVFGCLISILVTVSQRKRATSPDRPQDYLRNFYHRLEADSGNWISLRARQVQFLMKKSAIMHHVLFFSVFGLLPLLVALGAFSSNLIWILALYFDRRFFRPQSPAGTEPAPRQLVLKSAKGR